MGRSRPPRFFLPPFLGVRPATEGAPSSSPGSTRYRKVGVFETRLQNSYYIISKRTILLRSRHGCGPRFGPGRADNGAWSPIMRGLCADCSITRTHKIFSPCASSQTLASAANEGSPGRKRADAQCANGLKVCLEEQLTYLYVPGVVFGGITNFVASP